MEMNQSKVHFVHPVIKKLNRLNPSGSGINSLKLEFNKRRHLRQYKTVTKISCLKLCKILKTTSVSGDYGGTSSDGDATKK